MQRMQLHPVDLAIILVYLAAIVLIGFLVSRRAAQNVGSYFLAGNNLPWYVLGVSNASSMFDITGTMWLVYLLFAYGLKSAWLPWVWPTFNQVFLMVYLAVWLRRSNVMTGAEWIRTRFGAGPGEKLSHLSVVLFALVSVIGFLSYAFQGIGKFAAVFLPWSWSPAVYAILIMSLTTVYVLAGGMYSVVLTDLLMYAIMVAVSFAVAFIAIARTTPEQIAAAVPEGWHTLWFGWRLDLDWGGLVDSLNAKMAGDGFALFGLFGAFFMMIVFKGILSSMAGPAPNYDMQRVLAARTPREAGLMSGIVSLAQFIPRYLMIAGITVLALVYFLPELNAMGPDVDFEQILPHIIGRFLPIGVAGLMLAGLLAAFMSTFDSTVNAGAAYLVVDIYQRYINPTASRRRTILMSYLATVLVVAVGIAFGFMTESIGDVTLWIVAGLWGGYLAPNLLKWYWWRLNGYGYFAGMITGVAAAMAFPKLLPHITAFESFPYILLYSTAATILGSLFTPPESEAVLKAFYTSVRPWGLWGPVRRMVQREDPAFRPDTHFARDMVNVAIGTAWQLSLALVPIYFVLRAHTSMAAALVVAVATTLFLKLNWFDKLPGSGGAASCPAGS